MIIVDNPHAFVSSKTCRSFVLLLKWHCKPTHFTCHMGGLPTMLMFNMVFEQSSDKCLASLGTMSMLAKKVFLSWLLMALASFHRHERIDGQLFGMAHLPCFG